MTNLININDFKNKHLESRINSCFNKIKLDMKDKDGLPLLSVIIDHVEYDFKDFNVYEQDNIICEILDKLDNN